MKHQTATFAWAFLALVPLAPMAHAIAPFSHFVPDVGCTFEAVDGGDWAQHASCKTLVFSFDETVPLCPIGDQGSCKQLAWYSCTIDLRARSLCPDFYAAIWLA